MKLMANLVPAEFRGSIHGPLRRFYTTSLLASVGNGLTLSMFIVYLHNVRRFSIRFATLLLAASAFVGLVSSPTWGTMIDRFGPLKIAIIVYLADAAAFIVWAFSHTKSVVTVAAVALAIFGGAGWGPGMTMLARLVNEGQRQRAFGSTSCSSISASVSAH